METTERIVEINEPIRIPKVWEDLLAIEDFEALPKYPSKYRPPTADGIPGHLTDPTPFRDDSREVCIVHGDFSIALGLISGDNNYWLQWLVYKKDPGAPNFDDAEPVYEFGEAFYEIPPLEELTLSTGEHLRMRLEIQA